jgi:hypothetical protein
MLRLVEVGVEERRQKRVCHFIQHWEADIHSEVTKHKKRSK